MNDDVTMPLRHSAEAFAQRVVEKIDPNDRPAVMRRMVREHVKANLEKTDPEVEFDVYVVWFSFILGAWKGLCSTTLPDGRYYEVTFNKITDEVYIDTYVKVNNTAYPVND